MATTDTWISDLAARRLSIEHEAGIQASMLVSENAACCAEWLKEEVDMTN